LAEPRDAPKRKSSHKLQFGEQKLAGGDKLNEIPGENLEFLD
jgi:hypothetical protein